MTSQAEIDKLRQRLAQAELAVAELQEVRRSEAKYRALFESLDAGFTILEAIRDARGTLVDLVYREMNNAFVQQTGIAPPAGTRVKEVAPDIEDQWLSFYDQVSKTGVAGTKESFNTDLKKWFRTSACRIGSEGSSLLGIVIEDVTQRNLKEQKLRESEERQTLLLRLSDALKPLDAPSDVQKVALELLVQHFGLVRAAYYDVDIDQDSMFLVASVETDADKWPEQLKISDYAPDIAEAYLAGKTYVVHDSESDPRLTPEGRTAIRSLGVRRLASIPVFKRGKLLAVICVHGREAREWLDQEIRLLEEVADRTRSSAARAHAEAELRKALAEKESARAALEQDHEIKDRFLAVLSHELRNPLASISNSALALGSVKLDPSNRSKAIDIICRQAKAMQILLDDLLDISRLRHGKLELNRQRVSLQAFIDAAVEATQPLISVHRHTCQVVIPQEHVWVDGDPLRLSQALANLLTNAAKYTPAGGHITVTGRIYDDFIDIEVADDGIGMEPSKVDGMFEMFAQGPVGPGKAGEYGLGIGLALARDILALHNGRIAGFSDGPGMGSRFVVTLPRLVQTEAAAPPMNFPQNAARGNRPHVLLVDDNTDMTWSSQLLLTDCEVQCAQTAAEGLELAQLRLPEVAVLDLGLPDKSGLDLARAIRALPGGDDVLIIAATGWGRGLDRERTHAAGFDAHLVKPINIEVLRGLIQSHAPKNRKPTGSDSG
ncbi:Sensor histidine kinase RcsC [Comamonas sp. PE63]|uniref:histidine kinase n=1 Tax=Comamonas brasiliensis TaxID=1812482 RepID=A0ABS5LPV0_9BURK|nr:ATP-binding protein [Comamonas sp. PE63]MBS3018523.1 Sensor histidine kinase RcsC [Comamonas sp. PE63]